MLNYELPSSPPCDVNPLYIQSKIHQICLNILDKGEASRYDRIYDWLYNHIEQNFYDLEAMDE